MASESKDLDDEMAEDLDARPFIDPEPEEPTSAPVPGPPLSSSQTPLAPEKPIDPPESWQFPVDPQLDPPGLWKLPSALNLIKGPWTQTASQTFQPKTPVVPHLPSKYAQTYELERFHENRMIIFNHDKFLKGSDRNGTLEDEVALRETLEKFRFKIDPTYRNLNKKVLIKTVKNFALKTSFSRYGCICVVIMTHGSSNKPGFLSAYDSSYNEHEIFEYFDASKNPSLAAKPIIFIIQACRGADPSPKIEARDHRMSPTLQLDDGEDREYYHLPMDADRIVFHSSYVGRASVRHPQRGSWFIQTLCQKIKAFALTHDLETIFRMVRRDVALEHVTPKDWKQMPVVSTTTIREIHLALSPNLSPQTDPQDVVDLPVQLSSLNLSRMPAPTSVEPMDLRVPDDTPDASGVSIKPVHMPCACFLDYFEYLRTCLRSFVQHNAEDVVAVKLLTMAERIGDGTEYNFLKFDLIKSVWEHFDTNLHKFPPDGSDFIYRLFN